MPRTWFKHFSTASEGASLKSLWASGDYETYSAYWRLLEMMCRFEDRKNPGHMTISWGLLRHEFGWNRQRLSRVLTKIAQTFNIELQEKFDDFMEVSIPKFAELNGWGGPRREQDLSKIPVEVRSKKSDVRQRDSLTAETPIENNPSESLGSPRRSSPCESTERAPTPLDAIQTILNSRGCNPRLAATIQHVYPRLDWVRQEILKAIAWETANPTRRKKNFGRFVTAWLARAEPPKALPIEPIVYRNPHYEERIRAADERARRLEQQSLEPDRRLRRDGEAETEPAAVDPST